MTSSEFSTKPEEVEIDDLSRAGAGVGVLSSGQKVFVPFTVPQDRVLVEIEYRKKRYAVGKVIEVLKPSPQRVSPKCKVFGKCGGCEWQHVDYALQWETKVKGVLREFSRRELPSSAKVTEFPASEIWNYRNRIQLRGRGEVLGFYARKTHEIVHISRCEIAKEKINASLEELDRPVQEGIYKVELEERNGEVTSAVNRRHASAGFRQIHDEQNTKLREMIRDRVPSRSLVWDLYGGNGNLSDDLRDRCEVEVVDSFRAPRFRVDRWLKKQTRSKGKLSMIVDPPRSGCEADVPERIEGFRPDQLFWIGCDLDTWMRYVSFFLKRNWELQEVAIFDFFPQTHHVEVLALLTPPE